MGFLANFTIHLFFFITSAKYNSILTNYETVTCFSIINSYPYVCSMLYKIQTSATCLLFFSHGLHAPVSAVEWSYLLRVCLDSTVTWYADIPVQALNEHLCLNLEAGSS